MQSSKCGVVAYKKNNKWGYAGVNDGIYVEPKYEGAFWLNSKGYAPIKENEMWTFIHFTSFDTNEGIGF